MKQKLHKSLWLNVLMLVCTMLIGNVSGAWAEEKTITLDFESNSIPQTLWKWESFAVTSDPDNSHSKYCATTSGNNSAVISYKTLIHSIKSISVEARRETKNKNGSMTIEFSQDGSTWSKTIAVEINKGSWTKTTLTLDSPTDGYARINFSGTTAVKLIDNIVITYEEGESSSPSLSVSPATIAFGENAINSSTEETFTVTYANLTEDLSVSVGSSLIGVTVNPTTISMDTTSPQTVTVTYAPTAEGSISGDITISNTADEVSQSIAVTGSAYDASSIPTYNHFTGTIEEGDYIIYYNGYALKNTISSNRFGYATVTPSGNTVTTTDATIVWHIAPIGDYWTLYNANVSKYAAGTDTKNQGALIDEVTDLAKWTVTVSDGTYQFENLGRSNASSDSGNKWLRNNSTYGFACYASSTGGALTLYKLDDGTPSISAEDVTLAYDATSGSIAYTVKNEVSGGTVTAVSSADWLTVGTPADGTIALTYTANDAAAERTATVTLTYTYNSNETVIASIAVTQAGNPGATMTIAEARAATGTVKTTGVVTSVSGKTAYIQDSNAAIAVYNSSADLTVAVGDEIRVEGTRGAYSGLQQIQSPTITVLSQNNTVTPEVMTIEKVNTSTNQGWFIKVENAKVTEISSQNVTIAQSESTIVVRFNSTSDITFDVNDIVTLTGNISCYNTTIQIANPDVTVTPDEREEAEISFSVENLTMTQGSEYTAPSFNNPNNVSVTFTTTNANVASWDAANGLVLGSATGTATITATFEGDDNFKPATATLVVMVNEDLDFVDVVIGSGIYQKVTAISELEAGKRYLVVYENEAEGKVMNGVNNDNNYAGVKTAIIENDQIDNTTLNATPIVLQNAGSGSWFLLEDNKFLYVNTDGNYLNSSDHSTTNGTKWTISIDDDVMKINNDHQTARYLMYNSQQPRFACYKNTQKNVVLYKEIAAQTESVTVTAAGFGTYCSENALDFTDKEIKAFVGSISGTALTFNSISQVPANTGILLYKDGGATEEIPVIESATAVEANCLVGVNEQTTITADDYILSRSSDGVGFYKAGSHTTLAAHRAYIPAATAAGIKSFAISFGDTDAIGAVKAVNDNADIYNLAGQRVIKLTKGIYVVNGKKVLVK